MRRWGAGLGLAAAAVAALLGAGRWYALRELGNNRLALQGEIDAAAAASSEGEEQLASGRYDLVAQVSRGLVEHVLQEFVGYEQLTRRGNRFRIEDLSVRFRSGHAEVLAHADFDWRWGLFHGPIEVRYLAFARITPEADVYLSLRVAEARPLAEWTLVQRALAPIITLRLQSNLALKDLRLPLGWKGAEEAVAMRAPRAHALPGVAAERLRVKVPRRVWDVGARRVLPVFDDRRLALVVASLPGAAPDPDVGRFEAPPPGGAEVAARLSFLSVLLASAVRPSSDLEISIAKADGVWTKQGKLFGVPFSNSLDLANVAGVIDISSARLHLEDGGLSLHLELQGRFAGTARAKLFGFAFSLPWRMRPSSVEELPLAVRSDEHGVGLAIAAGALRVPLDIEASVGRVTLRGNYPLVVPASVVDRVVTLPTLRFARLTVPTRVERGEVLATRRVPVHLRWRLELPQSDDGFVRAHGDLDFNDGEEQ